MSKLRVLLVGRVPSRQGCKQSAASVRQHSARSIHTRIKRRIRSMLGFKSTTCRRVLIGFTGRCNRPRSRLSLSQAMIASRFVCLPSMTIRCGQP
jgi:hypothetical protein